MLGGQVSALPRSPLTSYCSFISTTVSSLPGQTCNDLDDSTAYCFLGSFITAEIKTWMFRLQNANGTGANIDFENYFFLFSKKGIFT